ncbi:hypothetical protein CK203_014391 [Vitis vinifera]|uniref:Retrovirus-related Pol polyprotein from transposon TNT 1-94 n=1 Tax=Vitis vinifera TaxID=29760 RepID=A0A438K4P0_VITVI|nr:hypothetical protein CK203_014391 [Vitis vinifera]
MEPHQEGASIGRPQFLISVSLEKGRSTNVIKPKLEWDRGDNEASENNARSIYSIFNAIGTNEFHRIATCTLAKEAWDILQVTHEGTNVVKVSKLQMLTSKFETIRMEDHENFGEFHAKLMDIVNSSFNLVFMASVIEEPLKKEVLSESCELSDCDSDEMSFDFAYETLYKECLSLKQ